MAAYAGQRQECRATRFHPWIGNGIELLRCGPLLKIRGRLYALVAIFALGCGALAAILIWLQNDRAIDARRHSLEQLVDSAIGVFEIWLGLHFLLSGYLIPLELLPGWVARIAYVSPFRYTLSFPVEIVIGLIPAGRLLHDLGIQWLYVVTLLAITLAVWRAGMRRFVAFGG